MNPACLFREQFLAEPAASARAPGRLEFIGNHTDYNGGLVLGVAVDRGVSVAVAPSNGPQIELISAGMEATATADIRAIKPLQGDAAWANYALGVFDQLVRGGVAPIHGFRMAVTSDLPFGAGLSSSAAFELAAGRALGSLYSVEMDPADWARLARRAENQFVGVPCGILDQGVSAFGAVDHLVRIDCKTESFERVPIPPGLHFWVFNTGVKHALLDSLYATRHNECHQALAQLQKNDPELKYLADASLAQVEALGDALEPALEKRARHVIEESARVREMVAALATGDLEMAGQLLNASHESSRTLFENTCPELDFLALHLQRIKSVYGCRLTGGGFGGAVMAVTSADFDEAVAEDVVAAYEAKFSHRPKIFHTLSGDGAQLL